MESSDRIGPPVEAEPRVADCAFILSHHTPSVYKEGWSDWTATDRDLSSCSSSIVHRFHLLCTPLPRFPRIKELRPTDVFLPFAAETTISRPRRSTARTRHHDMSSQAPTGLGRFFSHRSGQERRSGESATLTALKTSKYLEKHRPGYPSSIVETDLALLRSQAFVAGIKLSQSEEAALTALTTKGAPYSEYLHEETGTTYLSLECYAEPFTKYKKENPLSVAEQSSSPPGSVDWGLSFEVPTHISDDTKAEDVHQRILSALKKTGEFGNSEHHHPAAPRGSRWSCGDPFYLNDLETHFGPSQASGAQSSTG